jgi:hypothetical protein
MPDITQIMPPRVPLVDQRTGLISREWYRFFFNQFEKVGSSVASLEDLQLGPAFDPVSQIAEMQKQIDALALQPVVDVAALFAAFNAQSSAPVVKTADFSVAFDETWLINNKSGSTCIVTLPAPGTNIGRVLHFQNYQNQFLVSASINVIPIDGGAAAAAILADESGDTATLVSNGTNWVMTQNVPNNILLLE